MNKKILFISPHLSTGGLPNYLLKKIELLHLTHDIYVIEYQCLSMKYDVQRNKIKNFLKNKFYELPNDNNTKLLEIKKIISRINPDIIHLEEIPELFMSDDISNFIYYSNRKYYIIETSHTVGFDTNNKKYFPDKFILVSPYQIKQYEKFNIPIDRIDYPIHFMYSSSQTNKLKMQNREYLKLSKSEYHILIIGLFAPWKNQGYAFDIAKKLSDVKFHFVGNMASNFKYYWDPLINSKPDNCIIWGERDDTELFYLMADAILFPSYKENGLAECNPLIIKEGLSHHKNIFLFDQKSYMGEYDHVKNIYYLSGNADRDSKMIWNFLIDNKFSDETDIKSKLFDSYSNIKKNNTLYEHIFINFINNPKVEITGKKSNDDYIVKFFDKKENKLLMNHTIKINHWVKYKDEYFRPYYIEVKKNNDIIYTHEFNPTNKRIFITFNSKSLGDTIAWFPYVEKFREKWNCKLICSTFWNELFEKEYSNIEFVDRNTKVNNVYAMYSIGVYPNQNNRNKNDYRTIPLQQIASDYLGLDFEEIRPKISTSVELYKHNKKYITISKHSTAQSKYWNNPTGWKEVVNYLKNSGYDVISVAKEGCDIDGVIEIKDQPISEVIKIIKGSEFFIGLPSGLAWLAWVLNKKVVMISGFSKSWYEFTDNNYYVQNNKSDICTGCFVDESIEFDKGDWNWCPRHKGTNRQFECTKLISSQNVIDVIESNDLTLINKINYSHLDNAGYNLLIREFYENKIYDKYFCPKENDIIVDLGSCIGFYPLFSMKYKNIKKCYCVEPYPDNIIALRDNLKLMDEPNKFEIVEFAINDDIENASFSKDSNWTAEIKKFDKVDDIKINVIKFKDFLTKYNITYIDILKIDIEGSEYSVFSKKENLEFIKNNVNNIVGEMHFNCFDNDMKLEMINLFKYFNGIGFKVILNSVDGIDITDNILNNLFLSNVNKYSFDYYKQFYFYIIKEKNIVNNILVVGTPRSGTYFVFQLLVKMLGIAEHEKYDHTFDIHNIVAWELAFDNWKDDDVWGKDLQYLNQMVSYKNFNKVIHLIRDPLKTISSLLMADDWFWKKVSEKININIDKDNTLKMAMIVWYEWNIQCEKIAEKTLQVEYITEHLDEFCSYINGNRNIKLFDIKEFNTKEKFFNHPIKGKEYKKRYKNITWKDLEKTDKQLSDKIKKLAKKYNYF